MNLQEPTHQTTTPVDPARVSVVVPSYNHAPFIETTLRSVFKQTLPPNELLVIDDGSADGSSAIIAQALKDCHFPCELIARTNQGLCATLNEALSKTRGEYFAYLGSDDLWLPDFLAARLSTLESRVSAVLAYGHSFLIDEENQIIDCTLDWAQYVDGDAQAMLLQETIAPMSPTVMYRRAALERCGWNERAKLEDYELYLRLTAEGDFAFDPRVLSAWRQHGHNTSRDFSWMIDARQAAQRRVADRLGLSAGELARFRHVSQFAGAEDLLRLGEKSKAFKLLRQSFTGAPSIAALARPLARLCVPYSLIKWRKKRKQGRTAKRYGPLII
ncbi:MAG: glycosyltransferase family 2 protein [Pyrinomonadaceae bacterium]|nr:glycosyltransferase family 2 protein [Pyrinomonadaceae bacterium]